MSQQEKTATEILDEIHSLMSQLVANHGTRIATLVVTNKNGSGIEITADENSVKGIEK